MKYLAVLIALMLAPTADARLDRVPTLDHEVRRKLPADPTLFTQGLLVHDGLLYQSGGRYSQSRLVRRRIDSKSGSLTRPLPRSWFAEGIAVHDDELFLLTWREQVGARFSLDRLEELGRFEYEGHGWGLTSDGQALIMSNGEDRLQWRDADDFALIRELPVRAAGTPVAGLNELEWVNDRVLANVWQTEWLVVIDPDSGEVEAKVDLSGLLAPGEQRDADVLNGIAWDAATGRLYVTGKLWPWLFEIHVPALQHTP